MGMETIVPVRLQDCHWDVYTHDGKTFRVEGACNTDECHAVCCDLVHWTGKHGKKCEFLEDDFKCMFHKRDIHCKPISCLLWPTKQLDVDTMNELAERYGRKERCSLKVVEV